MLKRNNQFTSPNFNLRPEAILIDSIIIHYTDMKDDISALKRLCDKKSAVSAHYLINKQGEVFALVPDHLCAWHAGPSNWRGKNKVNDFSIGIELDNNGYEEFTSPLMHALIELCHELIERHPINPLCIVSHSDVAPSRKFDPGRLFDWQLLAKNGIGVFPENEGIEALPKIEKIQTMLLRYGYKIAITGVIDKLTIDVMRAFNEHFNPKCYDAWSEESQAILSALISTCLTD